MVVSIPEATQDSVGCGGESVGVVVEGKNSDFDIIGCKIPNMDLLCCALGIKHFNHQPRPGAIACWVLAIHYNQPAKAVWERLLYIIFRVSVCLLADSAEIDPELSNEMGFGSLAIRPHPRGPS